MLQTYQEKLALLSEMISFSVIDGVLHEREYQFLELVARELKIAEDDFKDLFHQELKPIAIRSEFQRIQHFYRLALLMFSDGVLHEKQLIAIKQIGINMGLNPNATKRILDAMVVAEHHLLPSELLLKIFKEQHN